MILFKKNIFLWFNACTLKAVNNFFAALKIMFVIVNKFVFFVELRQCAQIQFNAANISRHVITILMSFMWMRTELVIAMKHI